MGRCELLISIVPPTSTAFESHVIVDKLPTTPLKLMESAEEERQGWEAVRGPQGPGVISAELVSQRAVRPDSISMGGGKGTLWLVPCG